MHGVKAMHLKLEVMERIDLKYKTKFAEYGLSTPLRKAHFLAQLQAESNFVAKSENLNYSAEQLLKVFPKYFTKQTAKDYAYKPQAIANIVYANRMGNGNTASGEGWKYRGRGFLQITGKNNYKDLTKTFKVDYINKPDLLLNEADAILSALWYWQVNGLNRYADKDDLDSVSDLINIGKLTTKEGDAHGYDKRKKYLAEWKKVFGIK